MTGLLHLSCTDRVMVLAPHPDDDVLAAGGLLQAAVAAGASVKILFATDGENNPWPQRVLEVRWRIRDVDRERWGRRRRREALDALACLGVPQTSAVFLGFPDQGLTQRLVSRSDEPVRILRREIGDWRPTWLVVPSIRDRHPDHSALGVLARLAMSPADLSHPPPVEIQYLVHGSFGTLPGGDMFWIALSPEQQYGKRRAIQSHATQLLFHRRSFLGFVAEAEAFTRVSEPNGRDPHHPVPVVAAEDDALRFDIASRSKIGLWAGSTLSIMAHESRERWARLAIKLPSRTGLAPVRDAASGEQIAVARFSGSRQRGRLWLPLHAVPRGRSLFVKLEHRIGFFDEDGWREVSVPGVSALGSSSRRPSRDLDPEAASVCCVIPCYNVGPVAGEVTRETLSYADSIIAVDDGSTDDTGEALRRAAAHGGGRVSILRLERNCGKGVALLTAFREALRSKNFDALVTLDADGQHRPSDIPRLVRACVRERAELVVGERDDFKAMPLRSRVGNVLTRRLLGLLHPGAPLDTQSGFRALDRRFVEEVVRVVRGRRYETELRILLLALSQHRRIERVPIPAIYFDGNRSSHFSPVADSLRIFWAFLAWYL